MNNKFFFYIFFFNAILCLGGNGPFAFKKYVSYDFKIESSSTYQPTNYAEIDSFYRNVCHTNYNANATCYIKYSEFNNGILRKPFVFVEGISFEKTGINNNIYNVGRYFMQENNIGENYPDLLACYESNPAKIGEEVGYSTFNWATLVTGVEAEGYVDGDPLRVQKSPELLNKLYCAGFDICFIDFKSGEEYIESNGEALVTILDSLHSMLVTNQSTEKMVVCGASMGGLVAKYAVNKIEALGHTNWINKFISFDSPQMGANIPLAVQFTLKHFKDLPHIDAIESTQDLEAIQSYNSAVDMIKSKYRKLTCPSASQLVNYSCLSANLSLTSSEIIPSPSMERIGLLTNPYFNAWPQHCKKISISNGSRKGITQNPSNIPGDIVFEMDGAIDLKLGTLPANEDEYKKIFEFDILECLGVAAGTITSQTVKVKNSMALDLGAGSFRRDIDAFVSVPFFLLNYYYGRQMPVICNLFENTHIDNPNTKLCFIPAPSSLGFKDYENMMKQNQITQQTFLEAWFNNSEKKEDPNHDVSYFDVVYAPAENQTHVEITDENIKWVMDELFDIEGDNLLYQDGAIPVGIHFANHVVKAGRDVGVNPCSEEVVSHSMVQIIQPSNLPAPYFFSYLDLQVEPQLISSSDAGMRLDFVTGEIVPHTSYLVSFNGAYVDYFSAPNPLTINIAGNTPYGQLVYELIQDDYPNSDGYYDFAAVYSLKAYHSSQSGCGPAYALANNFTQLIAQDSIVLAPGFYTEIDASFDAKIVKKDMCENTGGRYAFVPNYNKNSETKGGNNYNSAMAKRKNENPFQLDSEHTKSVIVFPNPANRIVSINSSVPIIQTEIFDAMGLLVKRIKEQGITFNQIIQLEELSNGAYIIFTKTKNGISKEKLIVQN